MLSKLLVILVCILAVSSEARLHGRRRLSRSGHKIRRLMNQASPRCAAMLMDGCQYQCADQANPQQCTTCVEGNVLTNYDELVRHGCVEPPKMDKCSAIMMDGCMGLCTRGNTPECNECATRNAMNNYAELMENGCINRNRRLFRTADEAPQMCCQSMSPSCVACRKRQERNAWYKRRQEIKNLVRSMMNDPDWAPALEGKDNRRLNGLALDEMDESVGNHWGNGHSGRGPSKFNPSQGWWDEMDESVGNHFDVGRGGKCSNENFSYLEQENLKHGGWGDKAAARRQMIRFRPCAKAIFKKMCSGCGYDINCYQRNGHKYRTPATLPSQCNYLK